LDAGFKLGLNQFSDLSAEEFTSMLGNKVDHPMLTDRPHKDFEGSPIGRFEGDRN